MPKIPKSRLALSTDMQNPKPLNPTSIISAPSTHHFYLPRKQHFEKSLNSFGLYFQVEVLPEFMERESRRIKLFWSVMYEVCQTFCVWKTFCGAFCSLFSPTKNRKLDGESIETFLKEKAPQNQWLYDSVSEICEEDETCIKNCVNMEIEDDDELPWPEDEIPDSLYVALYDIANKYFEKCAKINDKTLPREKWLSVETFCQYISLGEIMIRGTCLASLT